MNRMMVAAVALASCGCASQGAVTPGAGSARSTELVTSTDARYRMEMASAGAASVNVPAAVERVWEALPEAFQALGLRAEVMDAARRVYGVSELTVRRRLAGEPVSRSLNCGARAGIANADSYSVRVTIRTQVQPDGEGGSRVRIEVEGSARAPGGSDPWVRCGSTNGLEIRLEDEIRRLTLR
jgi:hypothetical protein